MSDYNFKKVLPKHHNEKYINRCLVNQFAGYMSRCWDEKGVFEDGLASVACENFINYLASELPEKNNESKNN